MDFLSRSASKPGDTEAAVQELKRQFAGFPVRALVFFASHIYDQTSVAGLIRDAFPGAVTLGCSSYAELGGGGIHRDSISAMAFGEGAVDSFAAAAAENISSDPKAVDKAFASLERQLDSKVLDLDYRAHFGISLCDGTSPKIEAATGRMAALSDIVFIGGCASDDFSMRRIRQYLNGVAYRDAAILAVVKPRGPYALLKTQSAEPIGPGLIATKVSDADKTVLEFDGMPARDAFARGIGLEPKQLTEAHFLEYSLGVMAEGDPFIRAGAAILDNGGIRFFCAVPEGMRLFPLKEGDIVNRTRAALEAKRRELGGISAILDFDCAHRDMALTQRGDAGDYAKLFTGIESTGFATFGELFIANVNHTAAMAIFA